MIKKTMFFCCFLAFYSCVEDNLPSYCLRPFDISISKSLDNPDFNKILTIGSVEINGGYKGILLINKGLDRFLAFDRMCPNNDCDLPMDFDGLVLKCPCDESRYSVDLGGTPQTEGIECPAIEYKAEKIGNSIRISNY
ncbi:phosphoribosylaminoimidazole carboxylase [Polaribacter sp. Z014]|uniref:phosphoribosylaminoimidazole carboxylase n=1 Tax=Polaribacter sp. Z014 TaxID=2927126 RepID=UPI00201FD707|nr:phosphoribosylaminoimidazole carboxylase [Polaribacter sp. Z014]MCL7762363.1 phosphoribosylaminoimidazole carboxylase [Polaribacter sp. Z014]